MGLHQDINQKSTHMISIEVVNLTDEVEIVLVSQIMASIGQRNMTMIRNTGVKTEVESTEGRIIRMISQSFQI